MAGYDNADGIAVARELIPARIRKAIYAGTALLGYALAAAAVGLTTAGVDVPSAVTVALAVLGALTGPLGQLAATNVTPAPTVAEPVFLPVGDDPVVPDDDVEVVGTGETELAEDVDGRAFGFA